MPIYEYSCSSCSHQFELMQRIGEATPGQCENCGKSTVERMISQTSFMLKGKGWYTTDYAGRKAHGTEAAPEAPKCPSADSCSSGTCPAKSA